MHIILIRFCSWLSWKLKPSDTKTLEVKYRIDPDSPLTLNPEFAAKLKPIVVACHEVLWWMIDWLWMYSWPLKWKLGYFVFLIFLFCLFVSEHLMHTGKFSFETRIFERVYQSWWCRSRSESKNNNIICIRMVNEARSYFVHFISVSITCNTIWMNTLTTGSTRWCFSVATEWQRVGQAGHVIYTRIQNCPHSVWVQWRKEGILLRVWIWGQASGVRINTSKYDWNSQIQTVHFQFGVLGLCVHERV